MAGNAVPVHFGGGLLVAKPEFWSCNATRSSLSNLNGLSNKVEPQLVFREIVRKQICVCTDPAELKQLFSRRCCIC